MKQCGRLDLPKIKLLPSFNQIFDPSYTVLFGDTRAKAKKVIPTEKVIFVTGPEKGFSEKELNILEQKGTGASLHKNTLRAETAPIAATCLLIVN
jgi:RsmE family RNA methyltransferase